PTVYIAGPFGEFQFIADTPAICFAGGIGITPFISLVRNLPTQRFYIDYSAKTELEFAFKTELDHAAAAANNAQVRYRNTSVDKRIQESEILGIVRHFATPEIYVCGPSPFEQFIVHSLISNHVPKERIHVERFVQAGALPETPQTITF